MRPCSCYKRTKLSPSSNAGLSFGSRYKDSIPSTTEIAMALDSELRHSKANAREALGHAISDVAANLRLDPDPMYEKWILRGNPISRAKTLVVSPDGASRTVVWDCTSGSFYWHYRQDEAVLFLSGDAFLLEENGTEHHFGAGDFAFFPAGTVAKWRVHSYIRKIAFLSEPVGPFAPVLRICNKIVRRLGLGRLTGWTRISLHD